MSLVCLIFVIGVSSVVNANHELCRFVSSLSPRMEATVCGVWKFTDMACITKAFKDDMAKPLEQ